MKRIMLAFKISTSIGAIVGLVMCIIGWQHNPQCEFHCEGFIDWLAIFILWASWFVIVGIGGGVILTLGFYGLNLVRGGQNA